MLQMEQKNIEKQKNVRIVRNDLGISSTSFCFFQNSQAHFHAFGFEAREHCSPTRYSVLNGHSKLTKSFFRGLSKQ